MKKILIITGGVIGFLYSLIGPIVSYSDTAPLDDEIGCSGQVNSDTILGCFQQALAATRY
jgi:hypothetical protein